MTKFQINSVDHQDIRLNVLHNNTAQNFAWLRAFEPLLSVFASQRHVYSNDNRFVSNRPKAEDASVIKLDIA
jgi:hypothetical protein